MKVSIQCELMDPADDSARARRVTPGATPPSPVSRPPAPRTQQTQHRGRQGERRTLDGGIGACKDCNRREHGAARHRATGNGQHGHGKNQSRLINQKDLQRNGY
jgi:hypothetical protein